MVFIHVIRGRPSGLVQFPAGEAVKICFASVSSGICAMCPNRDRCPNWTMAERWGCLVNLLTSSLRGESKNQKVGELTKSEGIQKNLLNPQKSRKFTKCLRELTGRRNIYLRP